MGKILTEKEVLRCSDKKRNNNTVKKYYSKWRVNNNKPPERCDNKECLLFKKYPYWNKKKITFILDHKNGDNCNNRPANLQYLCPNCNSQQLTHGGKNRGRVIKRTKTSTSTKNFSGGKDVIIHY